jgi:uncharacterized RDD family membrane protein YckC
MSTTVRSSSTGRVDTAADSLQGYYAGFTSRAVAWVVDQSIALTIPLVIVAIMGYFLNVPAIARFEQFLESILPGSNAFISWFLGPQFALILTLVFFYSYFVFFLSTTGQTVGMALMGLRVVTTGGQRLRPWRALVRTLCYVLSLAPFGLGYLWVLGQDQRQAWHDRIAHTYVLYVWDARYEENFLRNAVYQLTKKREEKKSVKTVK